VQGKIFKFNSQNSCSSVLQASFKYLEYYENIDQGLFKAKTLMPGKVLIHESAEVDKSSKVKKNTPFYI